MKNTTRKMSLTRAEPGEKLPASEQVMTFADLVIRGKTPADAYREVYPTHGPGSLHARAYQLIRDNPAVRQLIIDGRREILNNAESHPGLVCKLEMLKTLTKIIRGNGITRKYTDPTTGEEESMDDLVEEITQTDSEQGSSTKIKVVSKQWAMDRYIKLMGWDAPTKIDIAAGAPMPAVQAMANSPAAIRYLEAKLAELKQVAGRVVEETATPAP
jgi:hypothetical protein